MPCGTVFATVVIASLSTRTCTCPHSRQHACIHIACTHTCACTHSRQHVCIHIACTHTCTCLHSRQHACIHIACTHTCACPHSRQHVCIHIACTHTCTYTHSRQHACICMHTDIRSSSVCVCTRMYVHTQSVATGPCLLPLCTLDSRWGTALLIHCVWTCRIATNCCVGRMSLFLFVRYITQRIDAKYRVGCPCSCLYTI